MRQLPEKTMLVFRCECDEVLSAETAKAGKLGECPGCGKILRIPEKAFEFTKLTLKRPDATIRVPKPPTTSVKLGDPRQLESKPAPVPVPPPPSKEAAKAAVKEPAKAEAKASPQPGKEAPKAEAKPVQQREAPKAESKPSPAEKSGKKSGEFVLPAVPPPPASTAPRPPNVTSAAEEAAEDDEELKRVVQRTAPRERRLDGKPFTNVKGSSGLPMKIILALGGIGVLAGIAYFAGLFGGKTESEVPKKQPPASVENKPATPAQPTSSAKADDKKTETQ